MISINIIYIFNIVRNHGAVKEARKEESGKETQKGKDAETSHPQSRRDLTKAPPRHLSDLSDLRK